VTLPERSIRGRVVVVAVGETTCDKHGFGFAVPARMHA
jgi:hypothetical protein